MPGKKMNSIKRPKVYEAVRKTGASKAKAAKIANSSRSANSNSGPNKLHGKARAASRVTNPTALAAINKQPSGSKPAPKKSSVRKAK